ncbi:MAG: alpha/beta hydrolase [Gemmatimonadota bacterium]
MVKLFMGLLVLAGVAGAGLAAAHAYRDPEQAVIDDEVRRQAPGRFIRLSDGITHYDVAGPDSGQRVILAHGFSTPYYIWDSTSIALAAAGFRVARFDYFGRGYSDRPDRHYDVDLLDRQMVELLDSLGWKSPVDIVGLSMGGIVVAAFAGRHPERTRSMTMVDPAAGDLKGSLPWVFKLPGLGLVLWETFALPGMAKDQISDFFEPAKWPTWPDQYRVQMRYRGFGRALRSTLMGWDHLELDTLYARVGARGTRSLLIWGREDKSVPFAQSGGVRKAIPQIRFEPIDRAAHLPHMERTDVVNPMLIGFLRQTP